MIGLASELCYLLSRKAEIQLTPSTMERSTLSYPLRNTLKWVLLLLWFLVLSILSCSKPEEKTPYPTINTPGSFFSDTTSTADPLDGITTTTATVLNIDSTDLKILPLDRGGIQRAYPLGATKAPFGHLIYTPGGYKSDVPEYPLLVFLHGWDPSGYRGSDAAELNELLDQTTPPGLINAKKWDPAFPFIVASPRLKTPQHWVQQDVHDFITYLIDHYQVNTSRIYLTGLSMGGGGTWYYAGERGDDSYVAAIVPICAGGEYRLIENLTKIPIWAFHGDSDATVPAFAKYHSVPLVKAINERQPKIPARLTLYYNTGHDSWSRTYSSQLTSRVRGTPFDVTIYEWLLQYRKE